MIMVPKREYNPLIRVDIDFVDGQTEMGLSTSKFEEAREFLNKYDHEGSAIQVRVMAEGEVAYWLLEQLKKGS